MAQKRNLKSRNTDERSRIKIIVLLALIATLIFVTGAVLSAFPQHLYVSNATKLGDVSFKDNNTAIIRGNQVQYGTDDIIPLAGEGRGYIKLTGRQTQLQGTIYQEGIRQVFASWTQNILLQQNVGAFSTAQAAQFGVDTEVIYLYPVSQDALNVYAVGAGSSSNYTIQFTQDTVYISEGGAMLKLYKNNDKITVSLIGAGYNSIWMRVI